MGFWSGVKKTAGLMVDVRVDKWMSYDYLKDSFQQTARYVVKTFTPEKAQYNESFEEAMERLHLTEDDLAQRQTEWTRLVIIFVFMATLLFGYLIYNLSQGFIGSSFITLGIIIFCLAQATRFHFWLYQLKKRRLGCTLKEWRQSLLKSFGL